MPNKSNEQSFSAPQPDFSRYDSYKTTGFKGAELDVKGYNPRGVVDPEEQCTDCIDEKAPCWKGYEQYGTKMKNGKEVPNCIPVKEAQQYAIDDVYDFCPRCLAKEILRAKKGPLEEAEYQGRKVPLGKPMRGDVKKFKVFVKDPSTGNVKKVNFGDPNMKIKKSNPARRRSFRARHNCDSPGPRTKARYWSCRKW
jgi:hypothetical protein